jgi:hypothetical protein
LLNRLLNRPLNQPFSRLLNLFSRLLSLTQASPQGKAYGQLGARFTRLELKGGSGIRFTMAAKPEKDK